MGSLEWHGGAALKKLGFDAGYIHTEEQSFRRHAAQASLYGQPGDRLWVRETWAPSLVEGAIYRATSKANPIRWAPSIHMPRWACRLVLEVLTVRVERLQDITEEGAKAEGVSLDWYHRDAGHGYYESYRDGFECLWNSIYGKRPGLAWEDNPWVWVTGFRKMEQRTCPS